MIDLSRRIADWQFAKKLANEVLDRATNETIITVTRFQLSLIERRSTDTHNIEQAGALDEEKIYHFLTTFQKLINGIQKLLIGFVIEACEHHNCISACKLGG